MTMIGTRLRSFMILFVGNSVLVFEVKLEEQIQRTVAQKPGT